MNAEPNGVPPLVNPNRVAHDLGDVLLGGGPNFERPLCCLLRILTVRRPLDGAFLCKASIAELS